MSKHLSLGMRHVEPVAARDALLAVLDRQHIAHDCLLEFMRTALGLPDGLPGIVMAIHTFGEYLDFHPHLHPSRLYYRFPHESARSGRSQRAGARAARKAISYHWQNRSVTSNAQHPTSNAQGGGGEFLVFRSWFGKNGEEGFRALRSIRASGRPVESTT
jgi:hypothetical protein